MTDRPRWLDEPRNVTRIVYGLYAVCLALLVTELVIDRKTEFGVEAWFGFYGVLGFLAYCGIVYSAKGLRRLVRRPEDYYGDDDKDDEDGRNG